MSANGELKKKTSQRTTWTTAAESILLDLWENNIEDLRGARKNSHIYQEMAAKLEEAGFDGSWSDIRTKIDNLTRKYKEERKKIGPTGGAPSNWEHYIKINSIIGGFKAINAYETMHQSTELFTILDDSCGDMREVDVASCSSCNAGPQKKKQKNYVNEELLKLARERTDMQREMQRERGEQVKEILKSLDNIASQNANFQKEVLGILREN